MTSTTSFFVFIPILAVILLAVNLIFAPHNPYEEKRTPFECGFHSFLGQNRTQFSISFFIFALLFLLFDLEILLVYPYVVSAYTNGIYGLIIMLIFFLALTLGFVFELGKNALKIDSRQNLTASFNWYSGLIARSMFGFDAFFRMFKRYVYPPVTNRAFDETAKLALKTAHREALRAKWKYLSAKIVAKHKISSMILAKKGLCVHTFTQIDTTNAHFTIMCDFDGGNHLVALNPDSVVYFCNICNAFICNWCLV